MVVYRVISIGWEGWKWKKKKQTVGCSKKIQLNRRKKTSGGYGDLTTLIPCEKTVMNGCKVPKRLLAV